MPSPINRCHFRVPSPTTADISKAKIIPKQNVYQACNPCHYARLLLREDVDDSDRIKGVPVTNQPSDLPAELLQEAREAVSDIGDGEFVWCHSMAATPCVLLAGLGEHARHHREIQVMQLHTEHSEMLTVPELSGHLKNRCFFLSGAFRGWRPGGFSSRRNPVRGRAGHYCNACDGSRGSCIKDRTGADAGGRRGNYPDPRPIRSNRVRHCQSMGKIPPGDSGSPHNNCCPPVSSIALRGSQPTLAMEALRLKKPSDFDSRL